MTVAHDFDETVLLSLKKIGGAQLAQRMLELFLEHTPQRLASARTGFQEGDLEAVGRAAHSLKSTAGHLRIARMQELAGIIEQLAMNAQHDAIAEPLREMEEVYARVAPVLSRHRSELDA